MLRRSLALLAFALATLPSPSRAGDLPSWWLERPAPAVAPEAPAGASGDEPASRPGKKLITLKDEVQADLTYTAYEHRTRIRPKEGIYIWDCSAMAAWMLRKVAPKARKAMDKGRPVARDFYRKIKRSPTRRAKDGWRRIADIENVRPGDMFAWERPKGFPSKNTGHVGFVVESPDPVPDWPGAYTVRIVDATSLPHEDDTRSPDGAGIGEGTILFLTDGEGRGIGYGWHGNRSRGVILTRIGFARLRG
ncbi:MAG: hypothetical protein ACE37F_03995 [Nannocystaceae bacterium]|nr:CHAP domain-containing protein [bacterium]